MANLLDIRAARCFMPDGIAISNHGPLILSTNYWQSPLNQSGLFYCSVNAGAIRLLVPGGRTHHINDMRGAKHCILSRGPWPAMSKPDAIELIFDDNSDSPWCLYLTPEAFDMLPAEPPAGQEWVISVWTSKDGKPHKALERVCHWRRVERIPWLKPW